MDLESIAHFAHLKGLGLVGTGDFTHPKWIKDLRNSLSEIQGTKLYQLKTVKHASPSFLITGEVCTIFDVGGKARKIHHLILVPDLDTAAQINDRIGARGDLSADGRPILHMSASELVEEIVETSSEAAVIPAHVWTPWYSLFGSMNGFNRIEECYEDMTRHIFALETGLSSDPPMNWRLSSLDRFTLVSNSDAHSPYPYRLGREANVFQVEELSYDTILDVLRRKDATRLKFTVETDPAYGKYHWTGHRNCGVSVPPRESRRLGGQCPVCRRPMTKGVDERTASLADRPALERPDNAIDYRHLLPLQELISASLVTAFGNEYTVVLETPVEQLQTVVEPPIAAAIMRVRNGDITVNPGYDGVYGEIKLFEEAGKREARYGNQNSLDNYV
jgi:uncharacterized protein (TIGR00375 family)